MSHAAPERTPAEAHMALLRTAEHAAAATQKILAELPTREAALPLAAAHAIAEDLATALNAVFELAERLDEDDNQLLGALQRWMP